MRRGLTVGACVVAVGIVGVFYAWAQGPGPGPGGPFGPGGPGPGGQFGRGRPAGGGGIPGGPGGPRGKRFDFAPIIDTAPPRRPADEDRKADRGLVANADMEIASSDSRTPVGFTLTGDVDYGYLGTPGKDVSGWGVRLLSGRDADGDKTRAGSVSAMVSGIRSSEGRWFRLRMRGLAQEGFRVDDDQLYLKVEFFGASGGNPLDSITKYLYSTLEQDRHELTTGKAKPSDGASWRTYALDFRLPFPEVDTLRVSAGFANGKGPAQNSEFWVDSLDVTRIEDPAEFASIKTSADKAREKDPPALESLVPLGGRWYYDPRGGSAQPPERFDHTNASKLYWRAGRLETPFADNMSSWLRRGWVDLEGKLVDKDRFIAESVEVRFTPTHMIVHTHNLPNHPTASFPDTTRSLDGNPNFVQEQDRTWYIPLEPRENPKHLAMNAGNENNALRLGPLGVAVNGVMLNDPYDAGKEEAMRRIDKCCGHPSPFAEYHYHKYPVCVKTPWFDDGEDHSPLIGWAFDGFGIYGPYESKGTMAKDSKENPLNAFNVHYDDARGWHYHVTPGRWPYILGGYWGTADEQNLRRRQGGGAGGRPEGPGGPLGQFGPPGQGGPQGQAGPSGPGGFRPPR